MAHDRGCVEKCREAFRQLRDDVSFMELPRTVNQTRHAVLRLIELAMWHEGWDEPGTLVGYRVRINGCWITLRPDDVEAVLVDFVDATRRLPLSVYETLREYAIPPFDLLEDGSMPR